MNKNRQTVLIKGGPTNGVWEQNIYLRFRPKHFVVRQYRISDSGDTLATVYCRQLSMDPLCITLATGTATVEPNQCTNEFNVISQLDSGTYKFTCENSATPAVIITSIDLIYMLIEFTD